jgi:Purple acid Phosphatase, N-terminal domain
MKKRVLAVLSALAGAGLVASIRLAAQDQQALVPPRHVQINKGPELERTTDRWAIIRWTTNNIKGTSLRYGVVHYGADPHDLGQTAKSPNRWNPGLPSMIYRVQINHLQPATTYYYRVEFENALDVSEGPESAIRQFTTERSP